VTDDLQIVDCSFHTALVCPIQVLTRSQPGPNIVLEGADDAGDAGQLFGIHFNHFCPYALVFAMHPTTWTFVPLFPKVLRCGFS
jgi:hypothetical protein